MSAEQPTRIHPPGLRVGLLLSKLRCQLASASTRAASHAAAAVCECLCDRHCACDSYCGCCWFLLLLLVVLLLLLSLRAIAVKSLASAETFACSARRRLLLQTNCCKLAVRTGYVVLCLVQTNYSDGARLLGCASIRTAACTAQED
jgi:hypothetical protein